jgi:hypothetical protein
VSNLVEGLAEGGHAADAIRSAGLLAHPFKQDLILSDAAVALSRAGKGAAALQIAGAIPGVDARLAALAEIARALRREGADGDAATAIRSAMSAMPSIGDLIYLSRGLPD